MSLPLLEEDTPVQVAGIFLVVVKQFGLEIGTQVDEYCKGKGAPDWFRIIKEARRNAGAPVYDDPFDPRFTLKETTFAISPVTEAIHGFNDDWKRDALDLHRRLNRWQHFGVNPTSAALEKVIALIWNLALLSNLPMKDYLAQLVIRVRNVRDGVYVPLVSAVPMALAPAETKFVRELEAKVVEQIQRPPVGADWVGPVGTRKIVISKPLADITENGVSILHQLPNGSELLKSWLRYYPLGGEARVSDDGAVTGFIKGQPTLIGWLGQEPGTDEIQARGFLLDHEYEFTGTDVRDTQSGLLLSEQATEPIGELIQELSVLKAGTFFNVSVYGDVSYEPSSGERRKIATVHPGIWFQAHLIANTNKTI